MFMILGDVVTMSDVMPAVSSVGSLGFAIWFAYHTTTTTLPNQQKDHREQLEQLAKQHAETIKEIVGEMKAGREAYDRWRTGHP